MIVTTERPTGEHSPIKPAPPGALSGRAGANVRYVGPQLETLTGPSKRSGRDLAVSPSCSSP
jgi:hypothetical protein